MTDTEIRLTTDSGEELHGLRSWPVGVLPRNPAVVLVHGFVTDKHDAGFDQLTTEFISRGVTVYRFDFSGCGQSTGSMYDVSLTTRLSELQQIVTYIKGEANVDASRVAAVGQSLGSTAVLGLADEFATMVLTCPPDRPAVTLPHLFGEGYNPAGDSSRIRTNGDNMTVGPQLWESLSAVNPLEEVAKLKTPTLIIGGAADELISPQQVQKLIDASAKTVSSQFVTGVHHNWSPKETEVSVLIADWVAERL